MRTFLLSAALSLPESNETDFSLPSTLQYNCGERTSTSHSPTLWATRNRTGVDKRTRMPDEPRRCRRIPSPPILLPNFPLQALQHLFLPFPPFDSTALVPSNDC